MPISWPVSLCTIYSGSLLYAFRGSILISSNDYRQLKRVAMKRSSVIKAFFLSVVVLSISVGGIAYKTIRDSMYRKQCTAESIKKNEQMRQLLITTYNAQPVNFSSEDKISLSGLLIVRPHAKRVVLLCHGLGMTKEGMHRYIKLFPEDSILLFDFRAHGQSGGDFISVGNYERYDVAAAYRYLQTNPLTQGLPVVGFGVSMGGAALLGAVAREKVNCCGVIIDSSFADLKEQVTHAFTARTGLPKAILMPATLALYELIAGYRIAEVVPAQFMRSVLCPVFIAHSHADETTPVAQARLLYEAAPCPIKEFWTVDSAQHAKIIHAYPEEYAQRISHFLTQCQ